MINLSYLFPIISRRVILMHINSEVWSSVSHFSSHNRFIVTELFSFGGSNSSPNYVLFTKLYFHYRKEQS